MIELFEKEKPGIRIDKRPKWCSKDLWQTLCGLMENGMLAVDVQFSKAERKRLRKRKQINPSVWAEKNRVLVKSRLPGQWKNDVTPYLVGIMDIWALPFVRESSICKGPQTGVSEAAMNFLGSRIDLAPGDVLYTFPNEKLTNENFEDRLHDLIKRSVRLRSYMTGNKKDLSQDRINLQHMTIYGAWASSVATLSNKPCRYAFSDEIDKKGYGMSSNEASSLALIIKRLITFYDISKHIMISSPSDTSGNIWIELTQNADVIGDYQVRCPFCDGQQIMKMEQIKWQGGSKADRKKIRKDKLAWYECEHCQGKWDDRLRDKAVQRGEWIARGTSIALETWCRINRPEHVGFHVPAWLSHFKTLSQCADSYLKYRQSKKKEDKKDHLNAIEALPSEEFEVLMEKEDKDVLKCKCDLPPRVVPAAAVALTAYFDMQKVGFPYVVRAWSRDYTRWLIDYGMLGSFGEIEDFLFDMVYPVQDSDRQMRVWRAGLDTGGGKYEKDISSTEKAYLWLMDVRSRARNVGGCRIWGTKGSSRPMPQKIKMGNVLTKTPSGKALKMGLRLVILDTDQMKDMVYEGMVNAIKGDTGGAWLHNKTDMAYARQITAEKKKENEKGVITWIRERKNNHYLDCESGAAALANFEWPGGGVERFPDPARTRAQEQKHKQPMPGGSGRTRPSWRR
ncbi:MAG: phage terminase large subunit family protein [Desulfobacterales bacterium]|nr:phage terminase large subunit family protein [Desulfobacterales bacterium]